MSNTLDQRQLSTDQLAWHGAILSHIDDSVIAADNTGRITLVNPAAERLTGNKSADMLGRMLDEALQAFISNERQTWAEPIRQAITSGQVVNYSGYSLLNSVDGLKITLDVIIIPIASDNQLQAGVYLILQDVNRSKLADHPQNINQHNLSLLIKYAPAAIAIFDRDMRYLAVSQRWMSDYRLKDSVLGLSYYDVFPETSDCWRQVHGRALAGEMVTNDEDRFQRLDGTCQWLRWEMGPWYDDSRQISGIIIFSKDITERKMAQEEVVVSRATLSAALGSMSDAVFISDAAGKLIDFNDAFVKFHRFKDKAECAKTLAEYPEILDVFLPDGTSVPLEAWAVSRALRGETVSGAEYTIRRRDSGESWVGSYSFAPICNSDGLIVGSVVTGRDVTEQRQIEEALRSSEQRLAGLVDTAMDGIITIDAQQRICLFNPAAEQLFGLSKAEVFGQPLARLVPQAFRDNHAEYVQNFGETGITSRRKGGQGKIIGLRANGEEFPLEASISQITLQEGKLFTVILRDISEREQAAKAQKIAEQRINEQRMKLEESHRHQVARQTAAAIAHELNQPLTAIASYTTVALQLLQSGGYDHNTLQYALENAERQAQRAGRVMHELLSLLHKDDSSTEACHISHVIDDAISFFNVNGELDQVKLVRQIAPELPLVLANRLQIQKVLVNLLGNALQAMREIVHPNAQIVVKAEPQIGNTAMLQVSICDTGKGFLAEQDLHQIFQPFYTTKVTGLGMGLAISRTLIEAHAGKLWAESNQPELGACFHFSLPFML